MVKVKKVKKNEKKLQKIICISNSKRYLCSLRIPSFSLIGKEGMN